MRKMLVSVGVVTYNSAEYILETLNSVYNQTYQEIELVISDDCSSDNTIEKCQRWLSSHKNRFVNTVLLTSIENTGVAKNSNRALRASHGEWYKLLDGDDILFDNCVQDFVDYVEKYPERLFIASLTNVYDGVISEDACVKSNAGKVDDFYSKDVEGQLKYMANSNVIYSSSVIVKRDTLDFIGGFDERYFVEDYPLYINALEKGIRFYFMDKLTAGYRRHSSLSNLQDQLFNLKYRRIANNFNKERCYKYYTINGRIRSKLIWGLQCLYECLSLNNKAHEKSYIFFVKTIKKLFK